VEPLNEHTHIVAFWVGFCALLQALQPIPHQLCFTYFLDHHLLSRYRLLLFSPQPPPDRLRVFILRAQRVVVRGRGAQLKVYARSIHPTAASFYSRKLGFRHGLFSATGLPALPISRKREGKRV
jgi:hypothetical protein